MVCSGASTATRCLCLPSARPHTSPVLFAVGELIHLVGRQVRARAGGSCSGSRSTHGDVRSIAAGTARLAGLVEVSGCQTNTHTHRSDELSNKWHAMATTTRRIVTMRCSIACCGPQLQARTLLDASAHRAIVPKIHPEFIQLLKSAMSMLDERESEPFRTKIVVTFKLSELCSWRTETSQNLFR